MVSIYVLIQRSMEMKLHGVRLSAAQAFERPTDHRSEVSKDSSDYKNCADGPGEEDRKASSGDGEGLTEGIFS